MDNHELEPKHISEPLNEYLDSIEKRLAGEDVPATDELRYTQVKCRDIDSEIAGLQAEREDIEQDPSEDPKLVRYAQELGRTQLQAEIERDQIPPVDEQE